VDAWSAPENRERLKIAWLGKDVVGASPQQGWPFLLYVVGVETKVSQKVERDLFGDTAFTLASHLCRFVRLTPGEAVDLPCLKQLPRIQDPMIVVLGRDLAVRGALADKKITLAACRDLVAKATDEAYEITLGSYIDGCLSQLDEAERLWRADEALKAEEKKGQLPPEEIRARRDKLVAARNALAAREQMLRASARPKGAAGPAETEESGLTDEERAALRIYRERARAGEGAADAFVLEALRGFDSAAMARTVLQLSRKDSWHAWQAGRLLAGMSSAGALEAIAEALRKGGSRERTAALAAFFDRDAGAALGLIHSNFEGGAGPVRQAAVRALAAQSDSRSAHLLDEALQSPDSAVRVLAARGAGRRPDPARVEPLGAALVKDADWGVRKTAAVALGSIRARECVPVLLETMSRENGIVREACHDALLSLSAQTFGFDLGRWKEWWSAAAASFVPASEEEVREAREQVSAELKTLRSPIEYHTIRTHSRNVLFLLDIGATMDQKMDLPPGATDAQREALWRGSKLDLAKEELIRVLGGLEDDVRFNVITYAGGVKPWRENKLASAAYRAGAIDFVRDIKAVQPSSAGGKRVDVRGGVSTQRTASGLGSNPGDEHKRDLYSALLIALGIFGDEPLVDDARPPADTIFLLVDGEPSTGEVRDTKRITEIVREINMSRGAVIHVVTFHERVEALYRELAEATGGTCAIHGR
jgi:hypothetical protein